MARYTGPKSKIARRFGEPIFGADKVLSKKNYAPGQHGNNRRRKTSEYGVMLAEKQKAKYTYGVLEKQFRNTFKKADSAPGITGEVLLQNLEARLDNVVYRLGIAPTRAAARQLVSHCHIVVDGKVCNIPSSHQTRTGCRCPRAFKVSRGYPELFGRSQPQQVSLVGVERVGYGRQVLERS